MKSIAIGPALLLFTTSFLCAAEIPSAIATDPARDPAAPASMEEVMVPSHGQQLLGVFYLAAGPGAHPTAVIMHGFPGYEQNLDLAQAIRRAGWNVLAVHYRGSWGIGGDFSFTHAMEDADAEVAFLRDPVSAAKYRVDPKRIVLIGHSMGGYMVASAATHDPSVAGVVMISAWNLAAPYAKLADNQLEVVRASFARDNGPADLAPLAGCTEQTLVLEIFQHRTNWDFVNFAPALANRPVLLVTADDDSDADSEAMLAALHRAGNTRAQKLHLPTDHPFSDHRIALETAILNWLGRL
jgi:pimeloyl-ACP methyl ester carboxylesterase